jgi:hypothetical protein
MKLWLKIMILSSICIEAIFADEDSRELPEGDPYAVSLSGEIRIHVKYDENCKETNPDVIESVFVAAEEVVTIAQPRRMLNRIEDPDIIIDNREPYRDYIVTLEYLKENYTIRKLRLPAYNSPSLVNFEFDCKGLKNEIWDARRERSAERDKKKAQKEAQTKAAKEAKNQPPSADKAQPKSDKDAAPSDKK